MRVIMIIAHPDDEVMFGFHDLIHNDVLVICMTNGQNALRKNEFFQSMNLSGARGHMLNYPDSPEDTWASISIEDFYQNDIKKFINQGHGQSRYELVVSHGRDGEYGNKQHIRTNEIARHVASEIGLPFKTFFDRHRSSDYATHMSKFKILYDNYSSQKDAISSLINFFNDKKKQKESDKNGRIIAGKIPNLDLLTKTLR